MSENDLKAMAANNVMDENGNRYIDLLIQILANTIYEDPSIHPYLPKEFNAIARENGQDWPKTAHTMAGVARLRNLAGLANRAIGEGIPGDFIETGVWRGGCCILMRAILAARGQTQRRVFAADLSKGFRPPERTCTPRTLTAAITSFLNSPCRSMRLRQTSPAMGSSTIGPFL